MPEGREEIIALLALERAEGIGHGRLRSLLEFFGSAQAALAAPRGAVLEARGRTSRRPDRAKCDTGRPTCTTGQGERGGYLLQPEQAEAGHH